MPDRTIEDYVLDTLGMFNVEVRNIHSRRALLSKLCEDIQRGISDRRLAPDRLVPLDAESWTEAAFDLYCETRPANPKPLLHLEHVVPRSVVTAWLCGDADALDRRLIEAQMRRVVDIYKHTCWVTTSERHTLNVGQFAPGLNHRNAMPPQWDPMDGNLWARYESINERRVPDALRISPWRTWAEHLRLRD